VDRDAAGWAMLLSMSYNGTRIQQGPPANATPAQFVRLREITEINGNPWATMAELNLLAQ